MSSLILELQQEVMKPDCDILYALRKAHLIASKLRLAEFDAWIQNELNGYKMNQDGIPEYRRINGRLKAWNPYHGWIPVILDNIELEKMLCERKLENSIGEIMELYSSSNESIYLSFNADITNTLNLWTESITTTYALQISKYLLKSICDNVVNSLLEWTINLERVGILGEGMTFNEKEKASAQELSQHVNYYLGPVFQAPVTNSQIVSGNSNNVIYDVESVKYAINEIRESIERELVSEEDLENAHDILDDIAEKIEQGKKPNIIKSLMVGLKDFAISAGANITAELIKAKMSGLF